MHRLGEPAADQLRKHLEQGILERHTQPCCAAILRWHLWLQWRSHALACANYAIFVVHRYMVCVCDLPPCGAWCPMPLQNGSKNFFANERPLMSSSRHRRQRNCVNCKCCVVDVPGVSHSCIEYESQLQTSCADTLNRVCKCVWFASVQGKMPLTPQKRVPKLAIVWYFFANERPLVSSIRHRLKGN